MFAEEFPELTLEERAFSPEPSTSNAPVPRLPVETVTGHRLQRVGVGQAGVAECLLLGKWSAVFLSGQRPSISICPLLAPNAGAGRMGEWGHRGLREALGCSCLLGQQLC